MMAMVTILPIGQRAFRIARSAIRSAWSQVISWPQAFAVVKIPVMISSRVPRMWKFRLPLESSRPVAKALSIAVIGVFLRHGLTAGLGGLLEPVAELIASIGRQTRAPILTA